jgi:mono/diheme cytochrome c family protein
MTLLLNVYAVEATLAQQPASNAQADGSDKAAEKVPPEHAAQMKAGLELFSSKVAALLKEHCLSCHGGDSIEGEFDLSTRESLLASGLLNLKEVDKSHLVAVIRHDEEPHMPKDGERLSDEAIAEITNWLKLGAPYSKPLVERVATDSNKPTAVSDAERNFWSFRPLSPVAPPSVSVGESWVKTPIDQFVLRKLQDAAIRPNGLADKRRLIRRAYFDLIGMPPSPQEVDAFINDTDPLAYEKLIDRLLQSPHYGERWARHWMDIARFAESHGYEQDYDRPTAYHYRDFLIRALNEDLPYDDFVRWQIAGDELQPDNPLAMMATGFLGGGAFPTQLTEAEFESSRYDELDDMTNTIGTAILGVSIGCARCHAHKFDPIPAADYYRMAANMSYAIRSEVELDLDPAKSAKQREAFEQSVEAAQRDVRKYEEEKLESDIRKWLEAWNPDASENIGPWRGGGITAISTSANTKLTRQADGSWLAEGNAPAKDVYTIDCELPSGKWQALRLECLADDRLPQRGPGRAGNGNFALGDIYLQIIDSEGKVGSTVRFAKATATHQQDSGMLSVAASIDNDGVSGWAVDMGGIGKDQAAVFELAEPLSLEKATKIQVVMVCNHPNPAHIPGKIRLSWSADQGLLPSVGKEEIDPAVLVALATLKKNFDAKSSEYASAKNWLALQIADYRAVKGKLDALQTAGPPVAKQKVLVTTEGMPHLPHHADDRGFPHFYPKTYLLIRGDVQQKRGEVEPGYLQVLMRNGKKEDYWKVSPPEGWTRTTFRRASLANWITDVDHGAGHLAARVIINRLWQHHFGRGLVATPSDFGKQGELPSHPELLDWLATDLIQNGWHLKRMHKLIMTSAVYMQNSQSTEDVVASDSAAEQSAGERLVIDRENRLLWHFPIRRLEGEAIRDSLLAISGKLDPTQFGPGTLDQNMRRRSIYFFIKRSQLIPMMLLFDWPEHLVGIGQRSVTTIAPQALAFMNSPQARSYAEGFASKLKDLDDSAAIVEAYRIAFGRVPESHEVEIAKGFLNSQTTVYQQQNLANASMIARVDFCQAILSMNELVYVD